MKTSAKNQKTELDHMPKAYTLCLNWDIKVVQHTQTNKCDTLAKHSVEIISSTVAEKMFKINIISTKNHQ